MDILEELLQDNIKVSAQSNDYKLLSAQIQQLVCEGKTIEEIVKQLSNNGYCADDIKYTIVKLYNKNKKDVNEIMSQMTKINLLRLDALYQDAIENNDRNHALKILQEENKMIPKKIEKNKDNEQIIIQFN